MKLFAIAFLAIAAVSGIPVENTNVTCVPGTLVKQDCNNCVCSADGTSMACTLMLCPPSSVGTKNIRERREADEKVCKPGETKYDGCNNCFCLVDGTGWACTMKACISLVCEPGTHYKKDCNECACSQDGTSELCTRKACPVERH